MTYVPYDNFLPAVAPHVNGATNAVMIEEIRNAAIEFCDDTGWLLYTTDPVSSAANLAAYPLDSPSDTYVKRVQTAWYNGVEITPKSPDDLSAQHGFDWRSFVGTPRHYTQTDDPTEIILAPMPFQAISQAIQALVVIVPTRASLTCDYQLFQRWYEVIAAGARARLQTMPAQSFTNGRAAADNTAKFRAGKNDAIIERNKGLGRTITVMRPPQI